MGDESSGSGWPGPALRIGVLVVSGILLVISRQIQQDAREIKERQQNQAFDAFLEEVQDPCGGGIGGSGQPLPGYEEICAPLEPADVELPVDELPAGPDLAAAYLASLQRLLTNTNPPSDGDIAVINEDGIYASGIRSLADDSRRVCPFGPPPISLLPDDFDLPSELSVLGRPRFSHQESAFRFVSDFCAPAPVSDAAQVE